MGSPRYIPQQRSQGFRVHRSVKMRMEAELEQYPGVKYRPRPEWFVDPEWMD